MAVKKTIAIAGAAEEQSKLIIGQLLLLDYRFLLMGENKAGLARILDDQKRKTAGIDAELIDCTREGCWEADIIILANHSDQQKKIAGKIKEVATQKIVLVILNAGGDRAIVEEIQYVLPHSCVISACFNHPSNAVSIVGENEEAVRTIAAMMVKAGFSLTLHNRLPVNEL
ncbi:MAG: oxidoreductase [Segetibacter sp.]|nr:oxidoreductase [Segetibacter sp.]